jgi:hypothetical protein
MRKLYYNILIAFKVWLYSMEYDTWLYSINWSHYYYKLNCYRERLQWHYFGMPQCVKDNFKYKAMWERIKEKAHNEWLKSIFKTPPLPQSVTEELRKAQQEVYSQSYTP